MPKGLQLCAQIYVPKDDIKQGFTLMANDVTDLMAAVEENMRYEEQSPNLHVKVQYDNVVQEAVPQIRKWFLDQGSAFFRSALKYVSRFDKDLNPTLHNKPRGARVVIGGFSKTELPPDKN